MTPKDWQSEVEAAAREYANKLTPDFSVVDIMDTFRFAASWQQKKLEAYYNLPKVPQTEAVREENKRIIEGAAKKGCSVELTCEGGIWECQKEELENKIAILESRASQFESTIKATLAREEKLVKALEAISKPPYKTDENGLIAAAHIRGDIARAALKAWRGDE